MEPNPDADPELQQLLSDLAAHWATMDIEESGFEVASSYVRAAYGRGYVAALTEPIPV